MHCSRINISIPLIYCAKVGMIMVRFNYNIFNCLYCVYIYKEVCIPIALLHISTYSNAPCRYTLCMSSLHSFETSGISNQTGPIIIDFTPGKVLRWWSWQVTRYPLFIKDTSPSILHIVPFPYEDQQTWWHSLVPRPSLAICTYCTIEKTVKI